MGMRTIALLFAGCASGMFVYAQSNAVGGMDQKFMMKAAQGGMAEVQLGQLAEQKGSAQGVKDFGARMVKDHSDANDKLKSLASSKGVTLPTTLDAKDQALSDKLSGMSGAAFDKMYMQSMVKDHRMDIAEFMKESSSGKDPDVKSFASMTLPILQDHLKMAEQVNTGLGGGASKTSTQ